MSTILKTLTTAAVSCGLAFSVTTNASAASAGALAGLKAAAPQSPIVEVGRRHHHHGGRNVGLAILGAAAATAIIAGSARADRGYYRDRRYDRCEFYDYKCSRGYGWACRKFDRYCD